MNNFWRTFWAATLSIIAIGVVSWTIIIIIVLSLMPEPEKFEVDEKAIVKMTLSGTIGERSRFDFNFSAGGFKANTILGVNEVIEGIKNAKQEENIEGIYLRLKSISAGMATVEEIRNQLESFKESGKFIIAYAENYSQKSYYLSSVADEAYILPSGMFDFRGLGTEGMFFSKALDKLDVEMQVIRGSNNKYKSAVEPFLYEEMSPANKKQTRAFLSGMWSEIATTIAVAQSMDTARLNEIANKLLTRSAEKSVALGFFDGVAFEDQVLDTLAQRTGQDEPGFLEFDEYVNNTVGDGLLTDLNGDKIALVIAEGQIVSGKQPLGVISSERYAKAIKDAREDDQVKAMILRVNSPGGSALASDVIWREIMLTKEEMPVIVSMGDLAASGGYFISCGADRIFADNTTITGSIGVFGLIPYLGQFFENKLGITFDRVATHSHSVLSPNKKLTDKEYQVIQEGVDDIYQDFISKVSQGRDMPKNRVDSIARGRVWTGKKAKEIGLVDEIGGLESALNYTLNEIEQSRDKVSIEIYPNDPTAKFAKIFEQLNRWESGIEFQNKTTIPKKWKKDWQSVQSIINADPYQARMPYMKILY